MQQEFHFWYRQYYISIESKRKNKFIKFACFLSVSPGIIWHAFQFFFFYINDWWWGGEDQWSVWRHITSACELFLYHNVVATFMAKSFDWSRNKYQTNVHICVLVCICYSYMRIIYILRRVLYMARMYSFEWWQLWGDNVRNGII